MASDLDTLEILKQDSFGIIALCRLDGRLVVCREFATARGRFMRWIAGRLARREARALTQLSHLTGNRVPQLIRCDGRGCVRSYIEGASLKAAPQAGSGYYEKGLQLVRALHAAGVTHNDLDKPENWLVTPDGCPAIVDFQIATRWRNRDSRLFRLCAREDVRHLYKNKRRYCASGLTTEELRLVERRSWPVRFNRRVIKPVYRFITRRLLATSDRARSRHSR